MTLTLPSLAAIISRVSPSLSTVLTSNPLRSRLETVLLSPMLMARVISSYAPALAGSAAVTSSSAKKYLIINFTLVSYTIE